MDLLTSLAQAFEHTNAVVAGVRPDQLGNATPCSEWDLQTLLKHTIGVVDQIGGAVQGEESRDPMAFQLGADLAAQCQSVTASTLAAWQAAGLDGEINIGAGPMPRAMAIGINLLDTATHSWDIARASDQSAELPASLAEELLGVCQGIITDEVRGFSGFGPAVQVGAEASPTERLVAFLGRQP